MSSLLNYLDETSTSRRFSAIKSPSWATRTFSQIKAVIGALCSSRNAIKNVHTDLMIERFKRKADGMSVSDIDTSLSFVERCMYSANE